VGEVINGQGGYFFEKSLAIGREGDGRHWEEGGGKIRLGGA